VLFSRCELPAFQALAPPEQYERLVTVTTIKDAARAHLMRKSGRFVFPADVEIGSGAVTLIANEGGSSRSLDVHVSSFYTDGWSVAAAGSHINAISAIHVNASVPVGYFTPDEEEWLSKLVGADEWRSRCVIAKQAAGKFLRSEAGEDFWQTLLITAVDSDSGVITIADPGSAVNAEDALRVITIRQSDYFIAVTFQC
jgi:hypothetical protein